mgnify:CR=1 FL=1
MSKVAVVTGGTSGIGRATALALKDAGYTVYELSRRAEGVEGLHHIAADVTDQQAVNDAVAQIMAAEGRIDVLVNNAGINVSVQGRKGGHTVYQNNGSQFVVLREGETLSSVAGEFGLSEKKLAKYNDFDAGTQPRPGDMVYIRAKNKRSQNGKLIHIAKDGETLHGISQMYGIRLKNLCSINRRSRDSQVSAGQQIRLM